MRRLKTVRRPPIYPNGAQVISPPVAPSLPLRCPHAVQRCPSVDSGLAGGPSSANRSPDYCLGKISTSFSLAASRKMGRVSPEVGVTM